MSERANIKIFEKMWYQRTPAHDIDEKGDDRFFQTAELVAREYYERIHTPKQLTIKELRERFEKTHGCTKEYFDKKRKLRADGMYYYTDQSLNLFWQGYKQCAIDCGILKQ